MNPSRLPMRYSSFLQMMQSQGTVEQRLDIDKGTRRMVYCTLVEDESERGLL